MRFDIDFYPLFSTINPRVTEYKQSFFIIDIYGPVDFALGDVDEISRFEIHLLNIVIRTDEHFVMAFDLVHSHICINMIMSSVPAPRRHDRCTHNKARIVHSLTIYAKTCFQRQG